MAASHCCPPRSRRPGHRFPAHEPPLPLPSFPPQPNFGDFFNRMRKQNQQRSPHQPPQSSGSAGAGGGGGGAPKQGGGGSGSNRPRAASGGINLTGGGSSNAAAAQAGGGQCPMRKVLGPVSKLLFTPQRLECPKLVVDMRAALARTQAVRALRPQELHIKVLTIGALAAALNMPCGAVREHYEKFSLGWFVAVHATIPFVAMMRKAVIMPKYAIIFTIAAAIAGQAVGARLERKRLAAAREAVAAATAAAAPPRVAEPLVVVAAAASTGKAGQRLGSPARQCPAKQMCSKAAGSLAVATAVAQPVTRPQQLLLRSH